MRLQGASDRSWLVWLLIVVVIVIVAIAAYLYFVQPL
jgi:flagellar basal body-associated protein FliL